MKKKLLFSLTFLLFFALTSWAQNTITVKGKVIDKKTNETLPGAVVFVQGNNSIATPVDVEGNFTLTGVPEGANIVIRVVGYKDIILAANAVPSVIGLTNELDEVIITGYRDESKIKSVSAVATVSSETIEQVPVATFDQILQGQAPGLLVQAGSGRPGASASVTIRGLNSIVADTEPLYVVDGVQINGGDFATLNPNDFATVNILKDASATSIYGSRGANGVIVITTKRGEQGKTRFNYRFMYGQSLAPEYKAYRRLTSSELIDMEQEVGAGQSLALPAETVDELRTRDIDWFDGFIREANTWSHEVNASGGSDKFTYYVSGSYFQQEGVAVRSGLDRYTMRINLDARPQDNLRFGTSTSLGYSNSTFTNGENGLFTSNPFFGGIRMKPYIPIYDPDGLNGFFGPLLQDGITNNPDPLAAGFFNPIEFREQSTERNDELKLITSVYAEYDIPKVDGLTIRTQWGADYRTRKFYTIRNPLSFIGLTTAGADPSQGTGGLLQEAQNRRIRFNGNTSINYTRTFGTNQEHEFSASIYNEIFYQNFIFFRYTGYGLNKILESADGVNNQANPVALSGDRTGNSLISYFGDISYTYKGKYSVKVGLRRDGSSRFGPNNRFATFYSIGANWVISEESFMDDIGFLDLLKLRASYGTSGNQQIGDFDDETLFRQGAFNGQNSLLPGAPNSEGVIVPGNPDLKWETNNQLNIGLDFAVLKNRVSGSIEYYNNLTTDLFLNAQLSRTTGFTSLDINVGKMRNAGVEFQVNADVLNLDIGKSTFKWNVAANYSYNLNTVEEIYNGQEYERGSFLIKEGEPYGSHFLVKRAGVDPSTGQYLWYDSNGNITNEWDVGNSTTGHGVAYAPHYGGFTNTISYGGISLSAFFSFAAGNTRYDNDRFFFEDPGRVGTNNLTSVALDVWRNAGDVTGVGGIGQARQLNDTGWIQDASYLRLRNITLSYALPNKILEKTGFLNSVRVFVQGQNVLTFTKWSNLDPEHSSNVGAGAYPALRQWTFGADIGF